MRVLLQSALMLLDAPFPVRVLVVSLCPYLTLAMLFSPSPVETLSFCGLAWLTGWGVQYSYPGHGPGLRYA